MRSSRLPAAASRLAAALALVAGLAMPLAAQAASVKLGATLSGTNEPGGGDADGAGTFVVEIDPDAGDVCYTVKSTNIAAPTMAHVHAGAAGVNGAPVLTIDPKGDDECIAAEPAVLKPIVNNPAGFYVNIHTADFPAGAIRGQLEKR